MNHHDRLNLTNVRNRSAYHSSLWGDTYLTPQEARIYITQMLMTLARDRAKKQEKTNATAK